MEALLKDTEFDSSGVFSLSPERARHLLQGAWKDWGFYQLIQAAEARLTDAPARSRVDELKLNQESPPWVCCQTSASTNRTMLLATRP